MNSDNGVDERALVARKRGFCQVLARWWRVELVALTVLPLLGGAAAGWIEFNRRALYESVTVVEVVAPAGGAVDELMLRTLCERMVSRTVLDQAAMTAEDDDSKGTGTVRANVVPGTRLIRLTVRDESPLRACDLAREVARCHRQMLVEEDKRARQQANDEVKREIRRQEDRVEETRKLLFQIGRIKGIPTAPGLDRPDPAGDSLMARQAELDRQVDLLEARIKALDKSPVEGALACGNAATAGDDPVAAAYLAWQAASDEAKRGRDKDGSNEEMNRAADGAANGAKAVFDARVRLVRLGLAGDLAAVHAEREAIRDRVVREVANRAVAGYDRFDFNDARADFERETTVLGKMKEELRLAELAAKLWTPPVEVRDQPVAARAPCVPQVRMRVAQGGMAGLVLAGLGIVPLALLLEGFSAHRAERRAARLLARE